MNYSTEEDERAYAAGLEDVRSGRLMRRLRLDRKRLAHSPALTHIQLQTVCLIIEHLRVYGYTPSLRELAKKARVRSTNAMTSRLDELLRKGALVRQPRVPRRARTLVLTDRAKSVRPTGEYVFLKPIRCAECGVTYVVTGQCKCNGGSKT